MALNYNRKPDFRRISTPVVLFVLGVFFFSGCSKQEEETAAEKREFSLPVEIGKVVYMDVVDQVRTVGNFQAEQRVTITAEVRGIVQKIPVDEGTRVKAGALLAQLDPREHRLELERLRMEVVGAEQELEKAVQGLRPEDKEKLEAEAKADESGLNLAVLEFKRMRKLHAQGFVSRSSLDEAEDRVARAQETLRASRASLTAGMKSRDEDIAQKESQLESAKRRYEMAQLDLSKVEIRAPFSGVIVAKKIERGGYAEEGSEIVEMIGSSRLKAVLEMPQSYRDKLSSIQGADFLVKELGLEFKHGEELAKMVRVIPDASIFSGNIRVLIDFPNPPKALFPGLTLEGNISFGVRRNVLHAPSISLVISDRGTSVYIMKDGRAKLVPVKAHKERNDFVEIEDSTGQLGPDVDLILRGSGAVFPGAKVFPTNIKPEREAPFNAAAKNSEEKPETVAEAPKT